MGARVVACMVVAIVAVLGSAGPAGATSSTQAIDAGNSLNAVACVPETTTCVAADSQGDALYATAVSATAPAMWTPWEGPNGQSPSEAVECPTTTLCLIAAGLVDGGGGNVYRASSLGGSFLTSFTPANGVNALSCASATFCVSAQAGEGFIRYTTNPAGASWTAVSIAAGALNDVSCLSSSFCAVVDDTGNVRVATTEPGVKNPTGWTATDVDGATALHGIACISTTACIAVDGTGEILKLTIGATGEATATRQAIDGAHELTAVSCTGATCAVADGNGSLFSSTNAGAGWTMHYGGGAPFTSVSCPSASLCVAATTGGDVTAFDPTAIMVPLVLVTKTLPAGSAGAPYDAQVEATGGTPPYRWSATGLPPGLAIDRTSGRITGTPLTAICVRSPCSQPPADYAPIVTVADSDGIPASRQLTIALAGLVVDAGPGPATGPAAPPVALVNPVVTGLKASHRVWRAGNGLARISKARLPIGTTFSFRLNVPAAVKFDFTKRLAGHKAGGRCVVTTSKKHHKGKACRRTVHAGALSFSGHAGANKVVFLGHISRARKLSPGQYTLTVTAATSEERHSAPATLSFTVTNLPR
jgi:hypothetical protein